MDLTFASHIILCLPGWQQQSLEKMLEGLAGAIWHGDGEEGTRALLGLTWIWVLFASANMTTLKCKLWRIWENFCSYFRLSRRGRTIIFSIHQPRYSIFKLFDSLTLLALGKVLYHGPAKQALEYFSSIGKSSVLWANVTSYWVWTVGGFSSQCLIKLLCCFVTVILEVVHKWSEQY